MNVGKGGSAVRSATRVPARWRTDLQAVLITPRELKRRIRAMALQIEHDFIGRDFVIVSLLNGTIMFLADLLRCLALPLRLDFIGVSSYGDSTSPGELIFTKDLRLDVRGRDVLLVDDILDTGRTMKAVLGKIESLAPRRVRICVLLDKPSRRTNSIRAHYVGFEIPDVFVVGYGLDFAERYRNLPFIGILDPKVYSQAMAPAAQTGAPDPHNELQTHRGGLRIGPD